jgi:hypothetical protein
MNLFTEYKTEKLEDYILPGNFEIICSQRELNMIYLTAWGL